MNYRTSYDIMCTLHAHNTYSTAAGCSMPGAHPSYTHAYMCMFRVCLLASVVERLTSNTTKVGVRGSNLGTEMFMFYDKRHDRSVGKHSSTRVDEGRKCSSLARDKMKARAVVMGSGKNSLPSDRGLSCVLGGRGRKKMCEGSTKYSQPRFKDAHGFS